MKINKFSEPHVSRKNARGKKTKSPGFEVNNHWNICDLCGCAIRNNESRKTWDGKVVCPDDWDYRHPQDFVRGRQENTAPVGLTRSESTDNFITELDTDTPNNQIPADTFADYGTVAYTPSAAKFESITPTEGTSFGGTSFVITGSNLTDVSTVKFGSNNATFTVDDDNTISGTTPANDVGVVDVVLVTSEGEQTFSVGVFEYSPTITYDLAVLLDEPLFYYPLNEASGSTITDLSTNGNDGTLTTTGTGFTYQATGLVDEFAFDMPPGCGAKIDTGLSYSLGNAWTFETWLNIDGPPAGNILFGDQDGSGNGAFFSISEPSAGTFRLNIIGSNSRNITFPYTYGTTIHFVLRHFGGSLALFINGAQQGTTNTWTYNASIINLHVLGNDNLSTSVINGTHDAIAFYTRTLGDAEILEHYNVGAA